MLTSEQKVTEVLGPRGRLPLLADDEVARKLLMLVEGQCESGAKAAASKYGYTTARYYQLLKVYGRAGSEGLRSQKRGPKTRPKCTPELIRQVIRHRMLDPEASGAVITQKLRQTGFEICKRTVERVLEEYGLQKKTL
jgi:transposase